MEKEKRWLFVIGNERSNSIFKTILSEKGVNFIYAYIHRNAQIGYVPNKTVIHSPIVSSPLEYETNVDLKCGFNEKFLIDYLNKIQKDNTITVLTTKKIRRKKKQLTLATVEDIERHKDQK